MPVLDPSEYNASYSCGRYEAMRHNAGYSRYERWHRNEGGSSLGEFWKDHAAGWINALALQGRTVLEIGCAKGFVGEELLDAGIVYTGIDVNDHCINTCTHGDPENHAVAIRRPDLAGNFLVGDVTAGALAQFANNQFDHVISFRFLECISDTDMPGLVSELNRICKTAGPRGQVHIVDDFTGDQIQAAAYYNQHTAQEWVDLWAWDSGTIIVPFENQSARLVK